MFKDLVIQWCHVARHTRNDETIWSVEERAVLRRSDPVLADIHDKIRALIFEGEAHIQSRKEGK